MLYPTDLIAEALRLKPDAGLPSWMGAATTCSHCARPIAEGDLFSPFQANEFFSDTRDLAAYNGTVCWRCVHLRKKPYMDGLLFKLVTRTDVYPIATNAAKSWLFQTPPEGPFLVLHSSTGQTQHLGWRGQVTLDNRLISVRFGPTLYSVRPAVIRDIVKLAKRINEDQKQWINPLLFDRAGSDSSHGRINPKARPLLTAEECQFLMSISAGERWAVAAVVNAKMPEPEQPAPVTQELIAKLSNR